MTAGKWMTTTCTEHILLIKIYIYGGVLSIKKFLFNKLIHSDECKLSRDGSF